MEFHFLGSLSASRRLRVPLVLVLLATAAFALAACGDDDDEAAAPPSPTDGGLTATLQGVDIFTATGTASFEADGAGTRIKLEVHGLPPGMHANHVHHGSCASQGEVDVPLTELDADTDGDAGGETEWDADDIDHFATGHYVAIHERSTADGVGDVIVCGDVS